MAGVAKISKCLSQQMSRPSQQMSNQQMSVSKCPVSKWKISKVPDTHFGLANSSFPPLLENNDWVLRCILKEKNNNIWYAGISPL